MAQWTAFAGQEREAHPGSAFISSEAAIQRRADDLEERFGDPWDPANPLGHVAVLASDEQARPQPEAEHLLDEFGLNAEFVPAHLGGRLTRADALARVLRPVFRRDPALGIGYGAVSILAGVSVWAAGTGDQQRWTADLLLRGGRLAVSYRELAHGNAFLRDEFTLSAGHAGGLLLNGSKRVIMNGDRAQGLVVFCRSSDEAGSRAHSTLLLDRQALPAGRVHALSRYPTVGLRGCRVTGLEFADCPLPAESLLGEPGNGVALALRSFALSRSVLPSMVLGGGDTALRTALRFARTQGVGGRPVERNPQARRTLAGAFTDLLTCDSLALVSTRAAGLAVGATGMYAAAAKYLLPVLLNDAVHELSVLLGSSVYARDGEFGIFQKHVRDLPLSSLGHTGSAACHSTIIPQLPRLARFSWGAEGAPGGAMFRLRDDLPALDFGRLGTIADGDPLCAELTAAAEEIGSPGGGGEFAGLLRPLVRQLVAELRSLRDACAALAPLDRDGLANPYTYALSDRYTLVLAAVACLGVWRHQRGGPDDFLAGTGWLVLALLRICRRLGPGTPTAPAEPEDQVFTELLRRYRESRSFDLYNSPLAVR
ncbi:acyl-CoA dehydrogenase family protein [Streptomyces hypolithicus]